MKNPQNIFITLVLIFTFAGVGFYAGVKYQQSKRPQTRFDNFQPRQFGQRQGFRPVNGEIISVDDKSITVKLNDNSSKIVFLTDTTTINKSSLGSKEDLKTGGKVAIFGIENSDGTITAQNIQLNPILRGVNNQQRR